MEKPTEVIEVRTEVVGFMLELRSYKEPLGPKLLLWFNDEVMLSQLLQPLEFRAFRKLFELKNSTGHNFFDRVLTLIEESNQMRGVKTT